MNTIASMSDALIIGAGPAGSVAATMLAREGWRVTIVEQHRFPRDKVCGDCISALGIDVLDRLEIRGKIAELKPARITSTTLVAHDGAEARIQLPRPMWGLARATLDHALLEEARRAGARILQPARCEILDPRALVVTVRDLSNNELVTLRPSWALLADGRAAFALRRGRRTGDFGLKAYFTAIDDAPDAVTLFSLDGHYCGLARVQDNRWNLAMSIPARRLREFGSQDAMLEALQQENPGLARRMRRATRVSEWMACPLPRFSVRRRWPARMVPLGNAAAALEPIGGEGIGLAMRSAELAAETLILAKQANVYPDMKRLRDAYKRLWNRRRFACRAAAMAMSSPIIAPAARSLFRFRAVPRLFLSLTGKLAPV